MSIRPPTPERSLTEMSREALRATLAELGEPRYRTCATNVLRSGKKLAAALTLLGDVVKGWLPVWLAMQSDMLMWVVAYVSLAVFIGHLYPIFYKFQGGKGVATALGVMFALSPLLALAALVTWIVVFAVSRYSSLAAIVAASLAPVYAWYLLSAYTDYLITVLIMSLLLV